NTAHGVFTASTQVNDAYLKNIDNLSDTVICSFFPSQKNSPQLVHENLKQIHPDDIEEMDLRWQMAMLTMRARNFLKKTGRKLTVNGNETIGFDNSKVECYKCHKSEHFVREYRALRNQDNKHKESSRRSVHVETSASQLWCHVMVLVDMIGVIRKRKDLIMHSWISHLQVLTQRKFHASTPNLSFTGLDEFVNKPVVENCKAKSSEEETKVVRKNDDALVIEEWVSDNEEEDV
nr:hypothetical protein [Tanacetum cinerariifolium]GFA18445.1 hypothetical protein [Tanacetum cinerariifolium]